MIYRVPHDKAIGIASFDQGTERWLALDGTEMVGRIAVSLFESPLGRQALIHDLYVEESARESNFAARLILKARKFVREQGVDRTLLTVDFANDLMLTHCIKLGLVPQTVTFEWSA